MNERKHRVLIVDDDEATARLLARFLADYEVDIATDGYVGLEHAITHKPDLLIADIWMPQLDGIAMVEELKRDPWLHVVPVIFLSAVTDAPHVAAAISTGARHFLPKPVDANHLLDLVAHVLGVARPRVRPRASDGRSGTPSRALAPDSAADRTATRSYARDRSR